MRPSRLLVEGAVPPALGRELAVIGQSIDRRDALEKVTGRAAYSSDLSLRGMLHAKLLRCPHAHARIRRIDVSRASALPGVRVILTADNTEGWHTQWYMIPQPAFPREIAYAGQEVAAVAADSPDLARQALELIEIDYEVLPAVLEPQAALRPDSPRVPALNVEVPREHNLQQPVYHVTRGDVARGLAEAELVTESRFRLPTQYHVDIQTRCTLADWDGARLTVYESSQGVWNVKRELARSLGLDEDAVRVVVKYMGGGFGSKAGAQRVVHYAARMAMLTGRPVKLELTRPEEFLSHPRRYAAEVQMRLGARRDGTLTAIDCDIVLDIGSGSMYASKYTLILHQLWELYRCPNVSVRIRAVYTNTPPTGPQRGVMDPIAALSMEAALDDLAVRLALDPRHVRLVNYVDHAQGPPALPYSSKALDRCIARVTEAIGWSRREALAAEPGPVRRGIGMACYMIERAGYAPFSAKADVIVRRDGSVELRAGVVEIGGGQVTILPMIVAEELGIRPERIHVHYGDTEGTHYAPSSHASRITIEVGPATLQAAALARLALFDAVAAHLGVGADRLVAGDERVWVHDEPMRSVSFAEACALLPEPEVRVTGSRAPNPADVVFRAFGAHAAEVEVDTETGEVRVVRFVTSHDIGRAINPKLVESQQFGAVVMGLGYGLYEEPEMDRKTGVLLNTDVHQYRTPTALESPPIETLNVEGEDPYFPYSAKPIGEAPLIGVMPAVRNAVLHAIGVGLDELPMTAARILEALERQHAAGTVLSGSRNGRHAG